VLDAGTVVLVDLVVVVSAAELSEVDVVSSLLVEEAAVELEALELLTCDEIELETALETDDAIAEDCDEPRPVVEAPPLSSPPNVVVEDMSVSLLVEGRGLMSRRGTWLTQKDV